MITMLTLTLLVSAVPAMAAEQEEGLNLFGGLGEEVNNLGAADESAAPTGDLIALDDLNISVRASDYVSIRQDEDGFVYIYTMEDDSIPYVIIGKYGFTAPDFADQFTEYMASNYADLQVEQGATPLTLGGGKSYTLIVYNYSISGYDAIDVRLFRELNGSTYMFGTKVVSELGLAIPNGYIEQVAGSMELLAGGDSDYPLHVDSTRSIEPTLSDLIPSAEEPLPSGTDAPPEEEPLPSGTNASPVGSSGKPVGGIDSRPSTESEYDATLTFDTSMASYTGTWISFQDGFKLYLPSNWSEYSISDEERNAGAIYLAYDASYSNGTAMVEVDWCEDPTIHSIDDIRQVFDQADDYVAEDTLLLNGIPCATYGSADGTVSGLMFFHPTLGEPYIFNICVRDYAQNTDICNAILCSLSLGN